MYESFLKFIENKRIVEKATEKYHEVAGFKPKKEKEGLETSDEDFEGAANAVGKKFQIFSLMLRTIDEVAREKAQIEGIPQWPKNCPDEDKSECLPPNDILTKLKKEDKAEIKNRILKFHNRFTNQPINPSALLAGRGAKAKDPDLMKSLETKINSIITQIVKDRSTSTWLKMNILDPLLTRIQNQYEGTKLQTIQSRLYKWIEKVEDWAENDPEGKTEMPKLTFSLPRGYATPEDMAEIQRVDDLLKDDENYEMYITDTAKRSIAMAYKDLAGDGITSQTLREKNIDSDQMLAWAMDAINNDRKKPEKIKDFFDHVRRASWGAMAIKREVLKSLSDKARSVGGSSEIDILPGGGMSRDDQEADRENAYDALYAIKDNPFILNSREVQAKIVDLAKKDTRVIEVLKSMIDPEDPNDPIKDFVASISAAADKARDRQDNNLTYVQKMNGLQDIKMLKMNSNKINDPRFRERLISYAKKSPVIMDEIRANADMSDSGNPFTVIYKMATQ